MRTEDVFKKILIKCLLSAGKAGIMMCVEIKAIKHLPPLLEAGHGNEAITRPLPASSQPLGGRGEDAPGREGTVPGNACANSRDSLTSKYRITCRPLTCGHQEPDSDLARQMMGQVPNAKGTQD